MDSDYQWFVDNYDELQKKYGDCFLAIKNETVLGTYETYGEAVHATEKNEEIGTFIVQECSANEPINQACIASMNFA